LPPRAISLVFLFLFFTAASATRRLDDAGGQPTAASSATAFLRSRCATTRYPDVCYDSLLPYASTFQTSHVKLAVAAANVAAAKLRAFSARIN
ncbi:hypothetical protein KFY49_25560, partial [Salmonella enterica subsp. enterica serovar 1,4,[5],12:i:-]|nr:hypothetical protein [Salmonella enterica subsp. enterica serovar 1,4,[5],12:i:-]